MNEFGAKFLYFCRISQAVSFSPGVFRQQDRARVIVEAAIRRPTIRRPNYSKTNYSKTNSLAAFDPRDVPQAMKPLTENTNLQLQTVCRLPKTPICNLQTVCRLPETPICNCRLYAAYPKHQSATADCMPLTRNTNLQLQTVCRLPETPICNCRLYAAFPKHRSAAEN